MSQLLLLSIAISSSSADSKHPMKEMICQLSSVNLPFQSTSIPPPALTATISNAPDSTKYRVVYRGRKGVGKGKQIVFISSDHEYRGEESLPALAKILAKRYGFTCIVIWALDQEGHIHPGSSNIKGLGTLKNADLLVIFTRFSNFSDDQMQHIDDYLKRGGPVVGLRTSTHAFRNENNPNWNHYDYKYDGPKTEWHGGFGEVVLGETWVGHYGKNHVQASTIIIEPDGKEHPIIKGVKNAWAQCGGYKAYPQGVDLKILARGRILNGMSPDAKPDSTKQELPIAWVRTYQLPDGAPGRAFTTTHGASEDLLNEGFRRMLINACLWAVGLETAIAKNNNIKFVGKYKPTTFNFDGYKTNVKPSHLRKWRSLVMPGEALQSKVD